MEPCRATERDNPVKNRDFIFLWLTRMTRWFLGSVFIYAGYLKAIDPQNFADSIAAFQLLPRFFITPLALTVPILEILSGLLLITGYQRRLGAFCILCLTVVFAAVIVSALVRGLIVNCSCFGEVGVPTRLKLWAAMGRDIVLFVVAVIVYVRSFNAERPSYSGEA